MTMNSVILHLIGRVFHFVWSLSFECCPHRPVQIFPSCNNQTTVLCGSMREIHNKISLKICIVMTPLAILTAKFNEHTLKKNLPSVVYFFRRLLMFTYCYCGRFLKTTRYCDKTDRPYLNLLVSLCRTAYRMLRTAAYTARVQPYRVAQDT